MRALADAEAQMAEDIARRDNEVAAISVELSQAKAQLSEEIAEASRRKEAHEADLDKEALWRSKERERFLAEIDEMDESRMSAKEDLRTCWVPNLFQPVGALQ